MHIEMEQDVKSEDEDALISSKLVCKEFPRAEFECAFDDLKISVREILGWDQMGLLAQNGLADHLYPLEMRGISIKYNTDENGNRQMHGCSLSAIAELTNTKSADGSIVKWALTTPYLKFIQVKEEYAFPGYDEVNRLVSETFAYMAGKRAQGDLFAERDEGENVKKGRLDSADGPYGIGESDDQIKSKEAMASEGWELLDEAIQALLAKREDHPQTKDKFDNDISIGHWVQGKNGTPYCVFQVFKNGRIKIRSMATKAAIKGGPVFVQFGSAETADPSDFALIKDLESV